MTKPLMIVALLGLLISNEALQACPFCNSQGQTLSGEINQADLIVLGTLLSSKRDPEDFNAGETVIAIDKIVKSHAYLAQKKQLKISRYIPVDPDANKNKLLIFCALYNSTNDLGGAAVAGSPVFHNTKTMILDAYRGEPIPPESKLPQYLQEAIKVREKDTYTQLAFFFQYLDDNDLVIASDALMEFGNSKYEDVRKLAEKLNDPDKMLAWLKNPNTSPARLGLTGLMLGHCGQEKHARELFNIINDAENSTITGLDGLLAGYVLIDPKKGFDYLVELATNEKESFARRYAVLKVLRFFYEYRADVIKLEQLLQVMKLLTKHSNFADLPIEDLRKWEQWQFTDMILDYADQESHRKVAIVRQSILKFALAASARNKRAQQYVAERRKEDPEMVQSIEQLIKPASKQP